MFKDNAFRICLIASISIHFGLMMPWPFLNFLLKQPRTQLPNIEMTYFSESRLPQISAKSGKSPAAVKPPAVADIKSGNNLTTAKTPENDNAAEKKEEKKPDKEEVSHKKEEGPRPIVLKDEKNEKAGVVDL